MKRPLTKNEEQQARTLLSQKWGIDPTRHYWYPLLPGPLPSDVLVFKSQELKQAFGDEKLQQILTEHKITKVWEIKELTDEEQFELDPKECEFNYPPEKYWTSKKGDWVIYVSHENTITLAGSWLIKVFKQAWPDWQQHLYQ